MAATGLAESVRVTLSRRTDGDPLAPTLELVRRELRVDRLSLHSTSSANAFCVLASAGDPLLAAGTESCSQTSRTR